MGFQATCGRPGRVWHKLRPFWMRQRQIWSLLEDVDWPPSKVPWSGNEMEILWKMAFPKFPIKSRNKILNNFQIQKLKKVESELLYCGITFSGLPEAGRAVAVYFAGSN